MILNASAYDHYSSADKSLIRTWLDRNGIEAKHVTHFTLDEDGLHAHVLVLDKDGQVQLNEAKDGPLTKVVDKPWPLASRVPECLGYTTEREEARKYGPPKRKG